MIRFALRYAFLGTSGYCFGAYFVSTLAAAVVIALLRVGNQPEATA